jgi:hypothetical protein
MKNIAMLEAPRNSGPFEFLTQIRVNDTQFINVFRFHADA